VYRNPILPDAADLDDDPEPREPSGAGELCRFCAMALAQCECVVETEIRCAQCLAPATPQVLANGSVRYGCNIHGDPCRTRELHVHYPKGWDRLDDVQYPDETPKLFI
jgi:hypothetical protein